MIGLRFRFFFFAIGFLLLCNYITGWKHLCSYVLSLWEDSIMRISFLRPVICFASPVATFHFNDVRQVYGQPSLLRTIGSRVILNPSLSETVQHQSRWALLCLRPMLIGLNIWWTCCFWRVINCRQQQRGSLDKFSLGLSMFYGYHVLTAKLCLSVPSALGVNAKQLSMEGSLFGRPMCFVVPTKLFNHDAYWAQQGEALLQLVPECQLKIFMNPITRKRSGSL